MGTGLLARVVLLSTLSLQVSADPTCATAVPTTASDVSLLQRKSLSVSDVSLSRPTTASEPDSAAKLDDPFDRDFVRDSGNELDKFSESQGKAEAASSTPAPATQAATPVPPAPAGKAKAQDASKAASLNHVSNDTATTAAATTSLVAATTGAAEAAVTTTAAATTTSVRAALEAPTTHGGRKASLPRTTSVEGCVTRHDERVNAWTVTTAKAGTPCLFGADDRDEGKHCIDDNGQFGTYGWCWTQADRGAWGSCSAVCPLFGQAATLARKIDDVKSVIHQISGNIADKAGASEKGEAPAAATKEEAAKVTPPSEGSKEAATATAAQTTLLPKA